MINITSIKNSIKKHFFIFFNQIMSILSSTLNSSKSGSLNSFPSNLCGMQTHRAPCTVILVQNDVFKSVCCSLPKVITQSVLLHALQPLHGHSAYEILLSHWPISDWEGLPGGWLSGRKGVAGNVSGRVGHSVCFYCCEGKTFWPVYM